MAGWGKIARGAKFSKELLQQGFNLMSHAYCKAHSNYYKPEIGYYIQSDEICAGEIDHDDDGATDGGKVRLKMRLHAIARL